MYVRLRRRLFLTQIICTKAAGVFLFHIISKTIGGGRRRRNVISPVQHCPLYPRRKKRSEWSTRQKRRKKKTYTSQPPLLLYTADGSCFLIIRPCHIAQHNLSLPYINTWRLVNPLLKRKKNSLPLYRIIIIFIIVLCKLGNTTIVIRDCAAHTISAVR